MAAEAQKRPAPADQAVLLDGVQAVLLDVEGTTTPLSFTKEVLIPYTKDNLKTFLEAHFDEKEVQKDIEDLRTKVGDGEDAIPADDGDKAAVVGAVVKYVLSRLEAEGDVNCAFSLLQRIWKEAFRNETIQGEVYDDVVPVLRQIVLDGLKVYTYSADPVQQQKLVLGHSNQGDLLELFAGHYDTSFGGKKLKESYEEIARHIVFSPAEILYLTHCPQEAEAALSAGMKTCVVLRDSNDAATLSDEQLQTLNVIYGLDELLEDLGADVIPSKRRHYEDYESTDGATNDSEYTGGAGTGTDGGEDPASSAASGAGEDD